MKKQKLILPISIIIGCIILGGFYYVAENNKQEHLVKQQEQDVRADIFNKNIECGKLISNIEKDLVKEKSEKKVLIDIRFAEIFYSRKVNSCLYVVEYYDPEIVASGPFVIHLRNALTNTNIDSFTIGLPGFFSYFNEDGSRNTETWAKLEDTRKEIDSYR